MSKFKILIGTLFLTTLLFSETKVITLNSGWNLVGNLDMNITTLRTLTNDKVTDVSAPGYSFKKSFVSVFGEYDGVYQTFQKFEAGKGYWVKMSESEQLTYDIPTYSENQTMSLNNGWNLVSGYSDMNITEFRTKANDSITDVSGPGFSFKKSFVSVFGEYDGVYQTFQKFEEGKGYWVKIDSSSESIAFEFDSGIENPETPTGDNPPPQMPGFTQN